MKQTFLSIIAAAALFSAAAQDKKTFVVKANAPVAEAATNIERLVDAYLNEHADESVSVEVLSEAEVQDHFAERLRKKYEREVNTL